MDPRRPEPADPITPRREDAPPDEGDTKTEITDSAEADDIDRLEGFDESVTE